jgi:hypothetical protein
MPYTSATDTPVLAFSYCNVSKAEKVRLSQIADMDSLLTTIEANMAQSNQVFLAVKGAVTALSCEGKSVNAGSIRLTNDGKSAYYLGKNKPDATAGDLYKITISGGKPAKSELYDTDVNVFSLLDNSTVLYFCDRSTKKAVGDLYINQALVDYGVPMDSCYYDQDNQRLLYYVEMDENDQNGTLKLWYDGTATKIADHVYTFACVDADLLYITDYDKDDACGTLYLYKNNESQKVDTEVSHIIGSNDDFGFVYRKLASKRLPGG